MTNPYAPPATQTSTLALAQKYPNPDIQADRGKVVGAGVTLIVLGGLQLLVGLIVLGGGLHFRGSMGMIVGVASLIEGGLNLILGIFTLKNSYGAAMTGLVLASIGLILGVFSFNIIAIGIRVAIVALVGRGVTAIRTINRRVAANVQENPFTFYYHHFLALLVRVMCADGHLDRRERKKITEICDAMNISRYEQQRVIGQASSATTFEVRVTAQAYRTQAQKVGLENPAEQLIVASLAVATADGILVPAEEALIKQMGDALGMSSEDIAWRIAMAKANLENLDEARARAILNVGPSASPAEIETSYGALRGDLSPENFRHIGERLSTIVEEQVAVLNRAKDLILASAPSA